MSYKEKIAALIVWFLSNGAQVGGEFNMSDSYTSALPEWWFNGNLNQNDYCLGRAALALKLNTYWRW